jgi:hypothetical protein
MLRFSFFGLMLNGAARPMDFLALRLYISRYADWFSRGSDAIRAAVQ